MKTQVRSLIKRAVRSDTIWHTLNRTIVPAAKYMEYARHVLRPQRVPEFVGQMFANKQVLHGCFAGMKYPEMLSVGSTLYPKLLGSYELELAPLLETLCEQPYTEIVDIGCAEGYYAVGLAMRVPTARVFAFDTNQDALRLCQAMAETNGVADRLVTGAFCDSNLLTSLPLTERALVISDCEGYEKQLFDEQTVRFLARYDVLIETHDFIDIEITSYLQQQFAATHRLQTYTSLDDILKAKQYDYPELEGLSLVHRRQIVREGRPATMEWYFFTPKAA